MQPDRQKGENTPPNAASLCAFLAKHISATRPRNQFPLVRIGDCHLYVAHTFAVVERWDVADRIARSNVLRDLLADRDYAFESLRKIGLAAAYVGQLLQHLRIPLRVVLIEDSDRVDCCDVLEDCFLHVLPGMCTDVVSSIANQNQRLFVPASLP